MYLESAWILLKGNLEEGNVRKFQKRFIITNEFDFFCRSPNGLNIYLICTWKPDYLIYL